MKSQTAPLSFLLRLASLAMAALSFRPRLVRAANDDYDAATETHGDSVRRLNDVAIAAANDRAAAPAHTAANDAETRATERAETLAAVSKQYPAAGHQTVWDIARFRRPEVF